MTSILDKLKTTKLASNQKGTYQQAVFQDRITLKFPPTLAAQGESAGYIKVETTSFTAPSEPSPSPVSGPVSYYVAEGGSTYFEVLGTDTYYVVEG